MTSCTSAVLAPSPDVIDGIATLTMKKSSGARKAPPSSTARAAQRRGSSASLSARIVVVSPVIAAILFLLLNDKFLINAVFRPKPAVRHPPARPYPVHSARFGREREGPGWCKAGGGRSPARRNRGESRPKTGRGSPPPRTGPACDGTYAR